jgi:hypothetical protein
LPPQPPTFPTIADALTAKGVSWKYYSGGRDDGTSTPSGTTADYCGICDPLTGFTSIMTTPLKSNLQDLNNLYSDIAAGKVSAVAFVRPPGSKWQDIRRTLRSRSMRISLPIWST